jgi:GT2 family glycosyltransferase
MLQKPSIDVIVLNFNSADHTRSCIDSILSQNTRLFHLNLIVVDNNSATSDRDKLAALESNDTKLVYSDINLGFSGGMMLGAKDSNADYYFLLNNDCELRPGSLAELFAFMESHTDAALCSGSMLDKHGDARSSFNYFPSLALMFLGSGLLRSLFPSRYPDRRRSYAQPVPVDVVTGAAMFIRGTIFRELNGLDTGYFLYCEEEDFAMRVRKAGWKTYHVPGAKIMHIGGASSNEPVMREALDREYYISLLRYLRIHHSIMSVFIFRLVYTMKLLRRSVMGKASYKLALFVLGGAPEKESMRFTQTKRK